MTMGRFVGDLSEAALKADVVESKGSRAALVAIVPSSAQEDGLHDAFMALRVPG